MKKGLLAFLLVSVSFISTAQLITNFTVRYGITQKGGITMIGNTATGCGAANGSCLSHTCAQAHAEVPPLGVGVDNDFVQNYVDIDGNATTFMSSSDSLNLPACSLISFAGLYWGAGGATSDANGTHWVTRAQVKLKVNNGAYQSLTADNTFDNTVGYKSYHNFKDITSIVTAAGAHGRYTVADMPIINDASLTSLNRWGGWAIVIVYRNDLQSLKNLIVFNGLANVQSGTNSTTNIPISGFLTPPTGPVNFQLGLITYDGDRGYDPLRCSTSYVGDSLLFQSAGGFVPISDASNPANDVMNSTITNNGVVTPYRNPNFGNTLGFDADIFVPNNVAKNYITNNATTATIREKTGGETVLTQVVTSAIDVFEPDNRGGLTVVDLNGGTVQPGDILEYTATIKNIGSNPSINTYIVDTFPINAVYVPGSMQVVYGPNAGVKTDVLSDDQGDFFSVANSIKMRIGTGANAVVGGTIQNSAAGSDSTQIKFRTTVSTDCIVLLCDSVINNRFHVYGSGFISGNTFDTGSNPTIFDGNGCPSQGTTNTPIQSIVCQPPVATNNSPACIGGNINLFVGSSPNATYSWTGPNGFTSTQQNPVLTNVTSANSGPYTVTISVVGTTCSFTATSTSVTVNPTPTMTSGNTATTCSGGTVSIPLMCSLPGTFTWIAADNANTTGESTTLQTTSTLSNTIMNTSSVPQTVTYTVIPISSSSNCPGAPQTVTVIVNPAPAMTSASSATVCSGGTVSIPLTATVASSYTWIAMDNPNVTGESTTTQTSTTLSNTLVNTSLAMQTVTYTVTPTGTQFGCPSAFPQIVTVTVVPVPAITSSNMDTVCSGTPLNLPLTATIPGTYTWVAADNTNTTGESLTTQSTSTINNTIINTSTIPQTVSYSVIPTSTLGTCIGTTQSLSVLVNPTPVMISQNTATVCSGAALNIALVANIVGTYTWIAADNVNTTGESTVLQNTSTVTDIITNNTAVPQTVIYTVIPTEAVGGCAGVAQTITVTVNPTPAMTSAIAATICSGTAVNIPLTSTIASSFTWVAANNPNTTGESIGLQFTSAINNTIANNSAVPQTVTYTVTPIATTGGCTGVAQTVNVTVNPSPVMSSATAAIICSGDTVIIPLTSVVNAGYTWIAANNPNTTGETTLLQTTSTLSDIIVNNSAVPQTVTYTVIPTAVLGGCVGVTQTVTVTVNPAPAMTSANSATICSGDAVSIQLTSTVSSSYAWVATDNLNTSGETTTIQTANPLTDVIYNNTAIAQTVTYTVTPTSIQDGCVALAPQIINVTVNPMDSAAFSYAALTYCQTGTDPLPAITGTGAGTFTVVPAGSLVINPSTGLVDLSLSALGSYIITYSTSGICPNSSSVSFSITTAPSALFSYSSQVFCHGGPNEFPVFIPPAFGQLYTAAPAGIVLDSLTGEINLILSTPGTYTITNTIVASGGCSAAAASTVITISPEVLINAGADATICSGSTYTLAGSFANGAAALAWTTSGTGTFNNASLSNAVYTPSAADIAAGNVTLTATSNDPAGPCTALSDSMVLNINPIVTISAGSNDNLCSGGSYTLNGTFGGGATSVLWITSGSGTFNDATLPNAVYTPSVADITAGTVTLTITSNDPAGPCSSQNASVVLTINPFATVNAGADASVCAQTGYTLSASFGGGATAGLWSTTGTGIFNNPSLPSAIYTASNADATAGSVMLIFTSNDPQGICGSVADTMLLIVNPQDNASFAYPLSTYCQTGTDPTPTVTGVAGGTFTFSPAGLVIDASTGTITLQASGLNTYSVYYTTNGVCPWSDTLLVTIADAPSAAFAYTPMVYCQSSNPNAVPIFPLGSSSGVYTSTPMGLVFVSTITGEVNLGASAPGTYLVTNMIAAGGGCAADTAFASITINPVAIVNAGSDDTTCSGNSITLSGSFSFGASSAVWSSGGTGSFNNASLPAAVYTPSAADIAAGTVQLTITSNDPSGPCGVVSDVMTLTIQPAATVTAGADASLCATSSYTLSGITGGGASSGTWSTTGTGTFSNTSVPNAVYTPSAADDAAGSVILVYTTNDPVGDCSSVNDSITLTISPRDSAAFYYAGTTYCQTGVNPIPTITGMAGGIFSASPGGLIVNGGTGEITLLNSSPGTYSVEYLTSGLCPDSATFTIVITSMNVASFHYNGPYCEHSSPDPNPSYTGGGSPGLFVYHPGGLIINSASGQIDLVNSLPGTYTVINTIAAAGGCSTATDSTVVVITPLDNASIVYPLTAYCANAVNPLPVISGLPGGTFSSSLGGSINTSTGEITLPVTPGTYSVVYTTNGACPNSDTTSVVIISAPVADAGPFQRLGCHDTVSLNGTASSSGAGYTFLWSTAGGTIISGGTTPIMTTNQAGVYTILVTDILTGCTETDTVTVTDIPAPLASFITSPDPATGVVPLTVTFTNTSTGANTVFWDFGDGSTSSAANPVHVFTATGAYTVTLYVSYNGNCVDSSEINVAVYDDYSIIIPNIFTPNGDLVNDFFTINSTGVASLNCYIYDRWGLKLYEYHTVDGGWDGHNANGLNAADGTYFFIMDLIDKEGTSHDFKGSFMLMR